MIIMIIRICDPQCDRHCPVGKTSYFCFATVLSLLFLVHKIQYHHHHHHLHQYHHYDHHYHHQYHDDDDQNLSYSFLTPHQIMGSAHKLSRVLQPMMMMMMMKIMIMMIMMNMLIMMIITIMIHDNDASSIHDHHDL